MSCLCPGLAALDRSWSYPSRDFVTLTFEFATLTFPDPEIVFSLFIFFGIADRAMKVGVLFISTPGDSHGLLLGDPPPQGVLEGMKQG